MKKKILTVVIICLVMLIPTLAAVFAFSYAKNNPVNEKAVKEMSVVSPDGTVYIHKQYEESTETGDGFASHDVLFDIFFEINNSGKVIESLPAPASEYHCFKVTYKSYNIVSDYKYYFTRDPENAYYLDSKGKYHKISAEAAKGFLATEYAMCVFPSADQPVLTVGDTSSVLPAQMEWKFLGYDNKFYNGSVSTSSSVPSCTVSGGLEISFDRTPDYIFVTMKDETGNTVFEDSYDKLDSSLFSDNTVYDVEMTAKWYEDDERINYGEGKYNFKANVLSPAVFYLSTSAIEYGDFVIISAKNIVDESLIVFASEPDIGFTPVFFEYGGFHHAVVPLSLDCITKNEKASQYSFTLSYGSVKQELVIDASVRKSANAYPKTSLSMYNQYYTDANISAFKDAVSEALSNECKKLYWMEDNMLTTPTDKDVKYGFGHNMIIPSSKVSYTHLGVDFKVKTNDTVWSCLPGEVVFAGETTLSGKTVIIDHGAGIKSLYGNMSSIGVKVGDVIDKNQIIGIVGSTGFCSGASLHFGLYVFDVPVRYYSYQDNGINIAQAVLENLKEQ